MNLNFLTNEKFPELAKSSLALYNHYLAKLNLDEEDKILDVVEGLKLKTNAKRVTLAALIHFFTKERPNPVLINLFKTEKEKADYEQKMNFKEPIIIPLENLKRLRRDKLKWGTAESILIGLYLEYPLRDNANFLVCSTFPDENVNAIDLNWANAKMYLNVTKTIPKYHPPVCHTLSDELTKEIKSYVYAWNKMNKQLFGSAHLSSYVKLALKKMGINGGINYLRRSWRKEGMKSTEDAVRIAEMMGHRLSTSLLYNSA